MISGVAPGQSHAAVRGHGKPPPEAETRILRTRSVRVKVIVEAISVLVVKE